MSVSLLPLAAVAAEACQLQATGDDLLPMAFFASAQTCIDPECAAASDIYTGRPTRSWLRWGFCGDEQVDIPFDQVDSTPDEDRDDELAIVRQRPV